MADIVPEGVPIEVRLTDAHGGTRPITRGIVLHSTQGPTRQQSGESLEDFLHREYDANVRYMQNVTNEVSPHFCVGPYKVARMVGDALIAWHAREHNQTHLGIEIAQPSNDPPFTASQVEYTARICAAWCKKYGIPAAHVTNSDLPGIIAHSETDQGRRDGKHDPGALWRWETFIPLVQMRMEGGGTDPAYDLVSPTLREWLLAHPEVGKPRFKSFSDGTGGCEMVWCSATPQHRSGPLVTWRRWIPSTSAEHVQVTDW